MHYPITHLGTVYACNHLNPVVRQVQWTENGVITHYNVRVRYSRHCYSREVDAVGPGDVVVPDNRGLRIFCPGRHGESLTAVQMVEGLFIKATSRVALTQEKNWSTYRFYAKQAGRMYFAFFRLSPWLDTVAAAGQKNVDLYVESAYPRGALTAVVRHAPFGKAVALSVE